MEMVVTLEKTVQQLREQLKKATRRPLPATPELPPPAQQAKDEKQEERRKQEQVASPMPPPPPELLIAEPEEEEEVGEGRSDVEEGDAAAAPAVAAGQEPAAAADPTSGGAETPTTPASKSPFQSRIKTPTPISHHRRGVLSSPMGDDVEGVDEEEGVVPQFRIHLRGLRTYGASHSASKADATTYSGIHMPAAAAKTSQSASKVGRGSRG